MDRVDKTLLILPLLPAADLLSTLFSLRFGGEEVGILARPMLETYGPSGLVALAVLASLTFFVFMQVVIYVKRMVVDELRFKGMHSVLAIPIYWFFLLEGVYVSTVILNFLVPFSPSLTQALSFRAIIVGMYFTGISVLNKTQMKQFPRV